MNSGRNLYPHILIFKGVLSIIEVSDQSQMNDRVIIVSVGIFHIRNVGEMETTA